MKKHMTTKRLLVAAIVIALLLTTGKALAQGHISIPAKTDLTVHCLAKPPQQVVVFAKRVDNQTMTVICYPLKPDETVLFPPPIPRGN